MQSQVEGGQRSVLRIYKALAQKLRFLTGQSVKLGGGRGAAKPFIPDDSCDSEIFKDASPDLRSPQLPYLTQDMWTCDRQAEDIEVFIYENEYLRVTINPVTMHSQQPCVPYLI